MSDNVTTVVMAVVILVGMPTGIGIMIALISWAARKY